jgi:NAD(P)-dependent dehydrogenase (short-subunit alcohol dehydrogenase family)
MQEDRRIRRREAGEAGRPVNNAGAWCAALGGRIQWSLFRRSCPQQPIPPSDDLPLRSPSEEGGKGCLVNMSPSRSARGHPPDDYAASKGAIDVFTRGRCQGNSRRTPGQREAPGSRYVPSTTSFLPQQIQAWTGLESPQAQRSRSGISKAVKFLVESEFITGETIDVNGGLFMR